MPNILTLALVSLLTCLALATTANAQNSTTLKSGPPIERSLSGGKVHHFSVDAEENSFVLLTVQQRGIDVTIKVSAPDGKSIGDYDSPNGVEGLESVAFTAIAAGSYKVALQSLNPDAAAGRYEIKIVEIRSATEQELKVGRNQAVMKEKGLALSGEIEGVIPQIKSIRTRISSQLRLTQILWDTDNKRASKCLSDAVAGYKEFMATTDFEDPLLLQIYTQVYQLRFEIIQVLAARDPDAALSFLYSTAPPADPYGNDQAEYESSLELSIAMKIMNNDPKRALKMALQTLKSRYSSELTAVVSQLQIQNPELAAELATEIANKLLGEKLLKHNDAMTLGIALAQLARPTEEKSSAGAAAKQVLTEEQYKALMVKLFNEADSFSTEGPFSYTPERVAAINLLVSLQSLDTTMDKFVAGSKAVIEKKLRQIQGPAYQSPTADYEKLLDSPVEVSMEVIEKAPPEIRQQLFIDLAGRQANSGEVLRAKQILKDRVTNPYQRRQWLSHFEQMEVNLALQKGDVEAALRNVARIRTPSERVAQLTQIIGQIHVGQKRATALSYLEQARSMLGPSIQAQNYEQMNALLETARAFSYFDSKRATEIIDPLVEQFNDLCVAARTLEGFGGEYFQDEELDLSGGSSVANLATQITNVLASLALTDFDRAKATSDKIRLPEVRLRAYLDIVQLTVQGESAKGTENSIPVGIH